MTKKRIFSLLLALTLAVGLLSGCSQSAEVVELEYETGPEVDLGPLLDEGVPMADEPALSTVLSPVASGKSVKKNSSAIIDYSNTVDGYVMVKWTGGGDPKLKVLIQKGTDGAKYQYNLRTDGEYETFPLSDGSGKYTIGVWKLVTEPKTYASALSATVEVKLADEFAPFVRPNQYVTFTEDSKAVEKAAELCAGLTDNLEKVSVVYDYVVNNTKYDKAKAATVKTGYLPDVDDTLETGKGICFDYAALMAAMLRSQEVPVKLIVGYAGNSYHAWINVWSEDEGWIEAAIYFDGKEWKRMDPTFDSTGKQKGKDYSKYIGDGENYSAKYQY